MTNIVVVDDHPLVMKGIEKVVQKMVDMQVIGEAANWKQLQDLLNKQLPDIIILDLNLPGKNGLDILKDINVMYPSVPVLILSMHSEERFAVRSFKAGAMGYLNKSSIPEHLPKAIQKILVEKRKYVSQEIAELLTDHIDSNKSGELHDNLSDRELQVMCAIASGRDVHEIAEGFSLSPQTVYSYRARIKKKMKLSSNVEMTRYAIENNLVE